RGCRGGAAAAGGGVDVEPAGGDGLVGLEPDDDRADEGVVLALGVLGGRRDHLLRQRVGAPGRHALVVGGAEPHGELVGHDGAAAGDRGGAVVHGAADRAGDLHRLDLTAEGPGEDVVDRVLD